MTAKKLPGAQYQTRNTSKLRTKVGVEGQRSILAYGSAAKRAASRKNLDISRGWRRQHVTVQGEGGKLKEGLTAMADTIGASTEQYKRIAEMDEDILVKMYENNDLTFEVFFNYEGIQKTDGGYFVSEKKKNDIDWFIRQYDKVAGSLGS